MRMTCSRKMRSNVIAKASHAVRNARTSASGKDTRPPRLVRLKSMCAMALRHLFRSARRFLRRAVRRSRASTSFQNTSPNLAKSSARFSGPRAKGTACATCSPPLSPVDVPSEASGPRRSYRRGPRRRCVPARRRTGAPSGHLTGAATRAANPMANAARGVFQSPGSCARGP